MVVFLEVIHENYTLYYGGGASVPSSFYFCLTLKGENMDSITTPKEFAEMMKAITRKYYDDKELCHYEMDRLMCDYLRMLGYDEGVDIFEETPKQYA